MLETPPTLTWLATSPEWVRSLFAIARQTADEVIDPVVQADVSETATVAGALLAAALLAYFVTRHVLVVGLRAIPDTSASRWSTVVWNNSIARRASLLVSVIVIAAGQEAIPHLSANVEEVLGKAAGAAFVVMLAAVIAASLRALRDRVPQGEADETPPVHAQLQIANLGVYIVAGAFIATIVTDQSLWYLITGLGAVAALLAIVFQHTILSTIASMQITQSDLIRTGDWIEVPERAANGIVVDVSLHTVKVQNWDNTILSVPTHTLLSESFQNWRGMWEAGMRRMQRAVLVDAGSIAHASESELERLRRFEPLDAYINDYRRRWQAHNNRADDLSRAQRRITNLALFRQYLWAYLHEHGQFVHGDGLLLVRLLAPTAQGVPIELYAFAKTTRWTEFEELQAEVLDHVLAMAGEFGLRIYQQPGDDAFRDLNLGISPNGTSTAVGPSPREGRA